MNNFMANIDRAPNKLNALSTISIARSTPAQNPRGFARINFIYITALGYDPNTRNIEDSRSNAVNASATSVSWL